MTNEEVIQTYTVAVQNKYDLFGRTIWRSGWVLVCRELRQLQLCRADSWILPQETAVMAVWCRIWCLTREGRRETAGRWCEEAFFSSQILKIGICLPQSCGRRSGRKCEGSQDWLSVPGSARYWQQSLELLCSSQKAGWICVQEQRGYTLERWCEHHHQAVNHGPGRHCQIWQLILRVLSAAWAQMSHLLSMWRLSTVKKLLRLTEYHASYWSVLYILTARCFSVFGEVVVYPLNGETASSYLCTKTKDQKTNVGAIGRFTYCRSRAKLFAHLICSNVWSACCSRHNGHSSRGLLLDAERLMSSWHSASCQRFIDISVLRSTLLTLRVYVCDYVRASVSGLLRPFLSCGFYPLKSSFIHINAVFDSVDRTVLWKALRAIGLPDVLLKLIEDMHFQTGSRVGLGDLLSERFCTAFGVWRGCVLAAVLFAVSHPWSPGSSCRPNFGSPALHGSSVCRWCRHIPE